MAIKIHYPFQYSLLGYRREVEHQSIHPLNSVLGDPCGVKLEATIPQRVSDNRSSYEKSCTQMLESHHQNVVRHLGFP